MTAADSPFPLWVAGRLVGTSTHNWWEPVVPAAEPKAWGHTELEGLIAEANASGEAAS